MEGTELTSREQLALRLALVGMEYACQMVDKGKNPPAAKQCGNYAVTIYNTVYAKLTGYRPTASSKPDPEPAA